MQNERTVSSIEKVVRFWREQDIPIVPKAIEEIQHINKTNVLHLPADFIEFYHRANGIPYPQECDAEGFYFYQVESIRSARVEFGETAPLAKRKIFIFSDYLVKCWWYGYEVMDDGSYTVGVVGSGEDFMPIANSLAEFLELYMADAPILYDHGE